ncbi:protein phosphatase 1 regulatory inhibitor subunit 11 [Phyllostomus discolor]|uniref:E3 ubiquitin-protein ligase PPP1R11 n=3 Tax=Chiroptera TaxID=9397 RepID=A0A834AU80_9CHIR|nr:protein phosphatase 1 regulatory inhibitor subunit 11 [Phyllostomus discolor]
MIPQGGQRPVLFHLLPPLSSSVAICDTDWSGIGPKGGPWEGVGMVSQRGLCRYCLSLSLLIFQENRSLTIKLRKRKPEKKVEWTSDTVDNEHMGRRSSKCCCIYEKPRAFGESSTESDEEEEEGCGHTHCVRGHRKGRSRATPGPSPTTPPQPPDPSQPPPGPMQH